MSWQDEEEFYGFILKDVFEKSTRHSLNLGDELDILITANAESHK